MSKIQEYQELKIQLEEVNKVSDISLNQIDFGDMGGLSNQFIVNGGNSLFLSAMLDVVKNNSLMLVNMTKDYMSKKVSDALSDAEKEANDFVNNVGLEKAHIESISSIVEDTPDEITKNPE